MVGIDTWRGVGEGSGLSPSPDCLTRLPPPRDSECLLKSP